MSTFEQCFIRETIFILQKRFSTKLNCYPVPFMSTFFYFRKPNRLFVFLSSYHWFGLFVHLSIIGLVINLVLLLPSMLLYSTLYVNVLCFFDSYWHINFVISLINLLVLDSIKCNNLFFLKQKALKRRGKITFEVSPENMQIFEYLPVLDMLNIPL